MRAFSLGSGSWLQGEQILWSLFKEQDGTFDLAICQHTEGCLGLHRVRELNNGKSATGWHDEAFQVAVLLKKSFKLVFGAIIRNVLHQDRGVTSLASLEGVKIDTLRPEVRLCLLNDVRLGVSLLYCCVAACRVQNFGFRKTKAGSDTRNNSVRIHVESVPIKCGRCGFAFPLDLLLRLQRKFRQLEIIHLVFSFCCGRNDMQDTALEVLAVLLLHGLFR
jgi:hypothetical protein